MFVLTALVYPVLLAALCVGAGLLVDVCSGGCLPGSLLLVVGAAALIACSQLTTLIVWLAPATPYALAGIGAAGFVSAHARRHTGTHARTPARAHARAPGPQYDEHSLDRRAVAWQLALPAVAYALALAPVLVSGRATFSSFMALSDSAFHMMGADFLIRHGQDYGHLDLANSYGQFINSYYNSGYPSGADTLFGGSARLLGLPLIWAFQPFNAFMLATATGPAWLLARRVGVRAGAWAAGAALMATVPALVYGYELIGSVKEITALPMTLALGALISSQRRWLDGGARRVIPFALVASAGVSALGVGFGAWVLAAAVVLALILAGELSAGRRRAGEVLALVATGLAVSALAALPTWIESSASVHVTQTIAGTSNPGNLRTPLRAIQVFGVWLRGSYKQLPSGGDLTITYVLIAIAFVAALFGAIRLLWIRAYGAAAWFAAALLVWLGLTRYATTWVDAKTLMLTSPVVVLLAWSGLAGVRDLRRRGGAGVLGTLAPALAGVVALALAGGMLVSDFDQYRSSNLAPTGRYEELASINRRFAGDGPALFTDFDEYALYELRDLDVGGPDFAAPPPALAGLAGGYGQPVELDRAKPASLAGYPLIVTRRDPASSPPPAAYRLAWQGAYYEVWKRTPAAPVALVHEALAGSQAEQCRQIAGVAARSGAAAASRAAAGGAVKGRGPRLVAALEPEIVPVALDAAAHPARWGHQRAGLVMGTPGRLTAVLELPRAGVWDVWVQGQLMPTVDVAIDGRRLGTIGGQLSGNSLVTGSGPPFAVRLSSGEHRLTLARKAPSWAPGSDGSAVLDAIYLTPVTPVTPGTPEAPETAETAETAATPVRPAAGGGRTLVTVPIDDWRSLCGRSYDWVELLPA